jgi:adenylylsulfate kinase-like enzyme
MTLSITVSGLACEGKSTIAVLIQQALRKAGINSLIANEDTTADNLMTNQPQRLQALVERLDGEAIIINQQQLRRGS